MATATPSALHTLDILFATANTTGADEAGRVLARLPR